MQEPDFPGQRYDDVEIQAVVLYLVQDHVPDERHQKRIFEQRDPEAARSKRYKPVWAMVHKLRKAMGNHDARYTLKRMIKFDEGYFTVESSELEQRKDIRGRWAAGKRNVAVIAESTLLEDIATGKASSQCRFFKAKVLSDHSSGEINRTVRESIDQKSIVFTDKIKGEYLQLYLKRFVYKLNRRYFEEALFDRPVIANSTES